MSTSQLSQRGDALWLGVKVGMVRVWVAGKLRDSLVSRGPYLSTLELLQGESAIQIFD